MIRGLEHARCSNCGLVLSHMLFGPNDALCFRCREASDAIQVIAGNVEAEVISRVAFRLHLQGLRRRSVL